MRPLMLGTWDSKGLVRPGLPTLKRSPFLSVQNPSGTGMNTHTGTLSVALVFSWALFTHLGYHSATYDLIPQHWTVWTLPSSGTFSPWLSALMESLPTFWLFFCSSISDFSFCTCLPKFAVPRVLPLALFAVSKRRSKHRCSHGPRRKPGWARRKGFRGCWACAACVSSMVWLCASAGSPAHLGARLDRQTLALHWLPLSGEPRLLLAAHVFPFPLKLSLFLVFKKKKSDTNNIIFFHQNLPLWFRNRITGSHYPWFHLHQPVPTPAPRCLPS